MLNRKNREDTVTDGAMEGRAEEERDENFLILKAR